MPVKAVIAEDEPLLRAELRSLLAQAWPELEIAAEAEDGGEALEAIALHRPEIVFLDVRMPGMTGIEVARAIAGQAHVVFVTAFDRFAIDAFESEAVDYVVKPVTAERLATTVQRLKRRLGTQPPQLESLLADLAAAVSRQRKEPLRWITASQGKQTKLVMIQDVVYFQSDNKYTRVATRDGGDVLIRTPIRRLLDELDPGTFRQVHRSTVVNLAEVATLVRDDTGRGTIRLKSRPEEIAVSEAFLPLFRQM
jgi:DNA-binding LytR/AlgR family response regulator